jgi:hypothetical protein
MKLYFLIEHEKPVAAFPDHVPAARQEPKAFDPAVRSTVSACNGSARWPAARRDRSDRQTHSAAWENDLARTPRGDCAMNILNVDGMNVDGEQKAVGVGKDMVLAAVVDAFLKPARAAGPRHCNRWQPSGQLCLVPSVTPILLTCDPKESQVTEITR